MCPARYRPVTSHCAVGRKKGPKGPRAVLSHTHRQLRAVCYKKTLWACSPAASQLCLKPLSCPQANLPLLQRELLHCARLAKQTPAQYLAQHEQLLLDASATSPVDSSELLLEVNENGKRRTPDRYQPLTNPQERGVTQGGLFLPICPCRSSARQLVQSVVCSRTDQVRLTLLHAAGTG